MWKISKLFRILSSTTYRCIRRESQAVCDIRQPLIKWPDIAEQGIISASVEKTVVSLMLLLCGWYPH